MQLDLERKFEYEGRKYDIIDFDFEALTCFDLIQAESGARVIAGDHFQLWGTEHIAVLAARAAHVSYSVVCQLSARDFMKVQIAIINFFNGVISTVSTQNDSEVPF